MGVQVISDNGLGKGDALRVAFDYADDDVIFVDADDTYPIERIPEFIDALRDCDVVIGERTEFISWLASDSAENRRSRVKNDVSDTVWQTTRQSHRISRHDKGRDPADEPYVKRLWNRD